MPRRVNRRRALGSSERVGSKYAREIGSIFKSVNRDIQEAVTKALLEGASNFNQYILNSSKERILTASRALAFKMVSASNNYSLHSLSKALPVGGLGISIPELSPRLQQLMDSHIAANTNLISGVSNVYINKVRAVIDGWLVGINTSTDSIMKAVISAGEESVDRAKRIAIDQTKKVISSLNTERCIEVGINKGIWLHSGGGKHPREAHVNADGKIFNINTGVDFGDGFGYVQAGYAPNCRCRMIPYLGDGEVEI